jgi:uncharacterized membrane protein
MEEKTKGYKKNTGMAVIAYIVFFIPLLTDAKNDPFVKYHVKQGLVLFIGYIIEMFVGTVPVFGWIISPLLGILLLILLIIGIINAVNGKEKPLPIVGDFAEKFKL